ncbi:hypothetical protein JTB14_034361 [Gonioctena quinquepunctata]|nr:hypothetical protein JTB14_034361 [Gonioctena quinquepunctata]
MNTVVTYCALLAIPVLAVTAYNFEDHEYNQQLADDLEDVYSFSYSSPRNRRDEKAVEDDKCPPPRRGKPPLCCAEKTMSSLHEEKKDIKRACFKEITGKDKPERREKPHGPPGNMFDPFNCEKVEQHRREMTCIQQCVGQKLNYIDADGNVRPEDFAKYIKEALKEEDYLLPLQDKIINSCMEQVKNTTANANEASPKEKCKLTGMVLDHCIFHGIQSNCPKDQIKDEKSCARFQSRNILSGPSPPSPQPLDDDDE